MEPFCVASVVHAPSRGRTDGVVIKSTDGREIVLDLDGDCCSVSYFEAESLKDLQSLVGERIVQIERVDSSLPGNKVVELRADEEILYHALKITTDKQELVVDWRNESNGYYDGECHVVGFPVIGSGS